MIWKGEYNDLEHFLDGFNKKHPTIKFDFNISKDTISF